MSKNSKYQQLTHATDRPPSRYEKQQTGYLAGTTTEPSVNTLANRSRGGFSAQVD